MREKLIKILSPNYLTSTISPSLSEYIVIKSVGRSYGSCLNFVFKSFRIILLAKPLPLLDLWSQIPP
jgi:hypothetical protein